MKRIIYGALACLTVCACTDNESVTTEVETLANGTAYMSVRINDAGSTSTRAEEGNYDAGVSGENEITTAKFYFYASDETFVTVGTLQSLKGTEYKGNVNIEEEDDAVVVLSGLTTNNYPNYVVTVLNAPSSFTYGATLKEMLKKLSFETGTYGGYLSGDASGQFVMSTTSFMSDGKTMTDHNDTYYFATKIDESNFQTTAEAAVATGNPVEIYVERLAAKVTLATNSEGLTDGDGTKLTPVTVNNENETLYNIGSYTVINADGESTSQEIYVKFGKWGLNATAKQSYMSKNIKPVIDETTDTEADGWNNTTTGNLGFKWDIPGDYRSYWGMSYNYDKTDGNYPKTAGDDTNFEYGTDDHGNTTYDNNNTYLNYISLNGLGKVLGSADHCAENTNTQDVLESNYSAITSALLSATVCDENGNGLDVVRHNGLLFTTEYYLKYVLNNLNALGQLNVYDEDGNQIDYTSVELGNEYDGYVNVVLNATGESTDWYSSATDASESTKLTVDGVNEALDAFYGGTHSDVAYKDGQMYYNIPIEHLNNNEDEKYAEGNYGVVRNHWYNITINSLSGLGHGVFDPDEPIIPQEEDKELYYLGAKINILSWKIVNQSVGL